MQQWKNSLGVRIQMKLKIKTVTVIGANGTVGKEVSGIFASFGDAKVYMVSRNIEKSQKAVNEAA